ncbi:hypothetical protein M1506_02330 [Patescibacteria group bacterium]|nr:hypothetical protein [Patescibacteria group bacterium]
MEDDKEKKATIEEKMNELKAIAEKIKQYTNLEKKEEDGEGEISSSDKE